MNKEIDEIVLASHKAFNLQVSSSQLFDPKEFFRAVWQVENILETLEKDYDSSEFYEHATFRQSKIVHLVTHLTSANYGCNLAILAGAIEAAGISGCKKIVLHILAEDDILKTISDFGQIFSSRLARYLPIVYLGSIGSSEFASLKKGKEKVTLSLRVMLDPILVAENKDYTSLDEYFKINYGSRYYENYDIYTEKDLQSFEKDENILSQVEKVAFKNGQKAIFPVDIRTHSIEVNDEVWFLDAGMPDMLNLLILLVEINQKFNLNLNLLSLQNYKLGFEAEFKPTLVKENIEIDTKVYYPVFDFEKTEPSTQK